MGHLAAAADLIVVALAVAAIAEKAWEEVPYSVAAVAEACLADLVGRSPRPYVEVAKAELAVEESLASAAVVAVAVVTKTA